PTRHGDERPLAVRSKSPRHSRDLSSRDPAGSFPPPRNRINRIRCFTAHVNARLDNPLQPRRLQIDLHALRTIPHLKIHRGSCLAKITRLPLHPPPATGADRINSPTCPVSWRQSLLGEVMPIRHLAVSLLLLFCFVLRGEEPDSRSRSSSPSDIHSPP